MDVLGLGDPRCPDGLAEAREVLEEHRLVLVGTEGEDHLLELAEVGLERLPGHEPELPHHVDLLERVEQIVGERDAARGRAAVLRRRPGADRGDERLGRVLHQELHRVRHHEGRNRVGQVLLELEKRLLELRIRRLRRHALPDLTCV